MVNTFHYVASPERGVVHTFRALAVLYYPHLRPETASRYLRRLIHADPYLFGDLRRLGYRRNQRSLSPKQVQGIVGHLGEPAEFYEYAILSKRPSLH